MSMNTDTTCQYILEKATILRTMKNINKNGQWQWQACESEEKVRSQVQSGILRVHFVCNEMCSNIHTCNNAIMLYFAMSTSTSTMEQNERVIQLLEIKE